jgi:hypothetical protein
MGLAARSMAGMALVLMRFIATSRLCGANAVVSFSAIRVLTSMELTYARVALRSIGPKQHDLFKKPSVKT